MAVESFVQGHVASQLVVSLEPSKSFDSKPNAFSQPIELEMLFPLSFFSVLCISQLVSGSACVSPSVSLFPLSDLTSLVPSVPSSLSRNDLL